MIRAAILILAGAAIIAVSVMLLALPAAAQMSCSKRSDVVVQLAEKYGEVRVGSGFGGGAIIEIFANPETGTWTVLRSFPNGAACLMAAGESWMPGGSEKEPGDPA